VRQAKSLINTVKSIDTRAYTKYLLEFNLMYCHRFSTSTCDIGNDVVGSSKDNKAPFTVCEISGLGDEEAKTASLLR